MVSLILMSQAHAAGNSGGFGADLGSNPVSGLFNFLKNYSSLFNQAGRKLAIQALPFGFIMLRTFLVIAIMWYGIEMMLGIGTNRAEPQNFFMKMFWWGTVYVIFTHYGWVAKNVEGIMQELGKGLASAIGSSNSAALSAFQGGFTIIGAGYYALTHDNGTLSFSLNPAHDVALLATMMWSSMNLLLTFVILLLVGLIVVATGGLYIFYSFKFNYYLALALGVGPLFLPTLMFSWTRQSFFDGWYQFTWTALMYKMVGPAILALSQVMFLTPLASATTNSIVTIDPKTHFEIVNWANLITIAFLAVLGFWFMWELSSIVARLSRGASLPDGLGGSFRGMALGLGKLGGK